MQSFVFKSYLLLFILEKVFGHGHQVSHEKKKTRRGRVESTDMIAW